MLNVSPAGCEYIVDAYECARQSLRSRERVSAVVDRLVNELRLRPLGSPQWHVFGGPGGITGLVLLAESHLSVHTFPETGLATFNLYHCQPTTTPWPWDVRLTEMLGARRVTVRTVSRGELMSFGAVVCCDGDGTSGSGHQV